MNNTERVVRAVDSLFDYWLDQHRCLHPLELEDVRQLKADALALLKEQNMKPVKIIAVKNVSGSVHCECARCKKTVDILDKFCRHCGNPLEL